MKSLSIAENPAALGKRTANVLSRPNQLQVWPRILGGGEKVAWDEFTKQYGSVFSSSNWVGLQCKGRDASLFLAVKDEIGLCGVCAIVHTQRLGRLLGGKFTIQGNPVIRNGTQDSGEVSDMLFDAIEREARKRGVVSIEFEGFWTTWPDASVLQRHGYRVRDIKGWVVDLTGSEAELYRRVAPSHRNRKNQAEKKHGVTINESDDVAAIHRLWCATYERAGKRVPAGALDYLRRVYAELAPLGMARIWLARKDGQVISGCFNLYYGDTVYYWHGGSISGERFGASQLLHWSIIRDSRTDFRRYHMGGSRLDYENPALRKQGEGIDTFKRLWGARPHDFYWGSKILRPVAHRVITDWIVPFARRIKALKAYPRGDGRLLGL